MHANHRRQFMPARKVMRDFTVNESQLRSLHAENFRRRGRFTLANLRRSERRWFAAGHIHKMNAMALLDEPGDLRDLRALYVQKAFYRFYFPSSCSHNDERSEESCEHDDRPKTGRASAFQGRREAWFKPISCLAARTAD
jgi:hypothetical protein